MVDGGSSNHQQSTFDHCRYASDEAREPPLPVARFVFHQRQAARRSIQRVGIVDATQYVEGLRKRGDLLRLASFDENGWCNGRAMAVVIDRQQSMAIMLETCGRAAVTNITTGAIVKFQRSDAGEPRIVGTPAYC
jgi:hypothetical protein